MQHVVFTDDQWQQLDGHLRAASPTEDGAFLLLRCGTGVTRRRLLVEEVILPPAWAWEAQGGHRLRPSGQWLSAVIGAAIDAGSGLAFVHSHPDTLHPASLSPIDHRTSLDWSRMIVPTLHAPFASLVWTPNSVTGLVFSPDDITAPLGVDIVEVLGAARSSWIHPQQSSGFEDIDDRQVRALGELGNERLRSSSVAVVGAGGTGSPLADLLARIGVRRVAMVDSDVLDTPSNVRRIVGSTPRDLRDGRPKVEIVGRHLEAMGLGTEVMAIAADVRSEVASRALIDADLILSTTDTHASRAFVNQLAVQYRIPLIDVGLRVGTSKAGAISGMPTDIRIVLPDSGCLWCLGVLDAAMIRTENLPPEERESLAAEGYVQGVDEPQPSLAALNWFAASLAVLAMTQLLSPAGVPASWVIADGWEHYFADRRSEPKADCVCSTWRGQGDSVALPIPSAARRPAPATS